MTGRNFYSHEYRENMLARKKSALKQDNQMHMAVVHPIRVTDFLWILWQSQEHIQVLSREVSSSLHVYTN
jgi:hypothetical protein